MDVGMDEDDLAWVCKIYHCILNFFYTILYIKMITKKETEVWAVGLAQPNIFAYCMP